MDRAAHQMDSDAELKRRARLRRFDRMKSRGASTARLACVTCPFMALLWVFGLWYEIPIWLIAVIMLGVIPAITLTLRWALRGREIRDPEELAYEPTPSRR